MSFGKKPKTINPDHVDPSIYYYDEVYDEMKDGEQKASNEKASSSRSTNKRPKYTHGLMESALERKSDKELRRFKKYARDREEAKDELSNEEVFVTSAYKKKLREIEKLEKERHMKLEREKRTAFNLEPVKSSSHDRPKRTSEEEITSPRFEPSHDRADRTTRSTPQSSTDDEREKSTRERPQLKTLDDRRRYLRQVLAKRTIGEKYQQAVQRYMERKSVASR